VADAECDSESNSAIHHRRPLPPAQPASPPPLARADSWWPAGWLVWTKKCASSARGMRNPCRRPSDCRLARRRCPSKAWPIHGRSRMSLAVDQERVETTTKIIERKCKSHIDDSGIGVVVSTCQAMWQPFGGRRRNLIDVGQASSAADQPAVRTGVKPRRQAMMPIAGRAGYESGGAETRYPAAARSHMCGDRRPASKTF